MTVEASNEATGGATNSRANDNSHWTEGDAESSADTGAGEGTGGDAARCDYSFAEGLATTLITVLEKVDPHTQTNGA